MDGSEEFERYIRSLSDIDTLRLSKTILDRKIKILTLNKEKGIINAEIRGTEIVPYFISIDLAQGSLFSAIKHDCYDFINRKQKRNQFCKHLIKLFYYLKKEDLRFANEVLKKLTMKANGNDKKKNFTQVDLNRFINKDLENRLNFEYCGFDYFFDTAELSGSEIERITKVLVESTVLPASISGHHGGYDGGLFDHTLLVTNYAYRICKSTKDQIGVKKAILAAIYHDFGKVPRYAFKRTLYNCQITTTREDLDAINREIAQKFNCSGRDFHVEGAIAVIKKYNIWFDDEMYKAIIFHHGSWSKYKPFKTNKLGTLIHVADMIASQIFQI